MQARAIMPRNFRRWPRGAFWAAAGLIAVLALVLSQWRGQPVSSDVRALDSPPRAGACEVVEVLGGDMLVVRQQQGEKAGPQKEPATFRLRLLGINVPPEMNDLARAKLNELTQEAAAASLELDQRRVDPQGNAYAHLYIGHRLVAAELVRAGAARYEPYPGDDAAIGRLLGQAQDVARKAGRGLWAETRSERSNTRRQGAR